MAAAAMIVVMGVAGSGKTTLARALADRLGVAWLDADDVHPPASIAKMAAGVALDDDDRAPWLDTVAGWMTTHDSGGGVVACSALRRRYRDRLRRASPALRLLFLDGDEALVAARLRGRTGHFWRPELLPSQYATLEPPEPDEDALRVSIATDVAALVEGALAWMLSAG